MPIAISLSERLSDPSASPSAPTRTRERVSHHARHTRRVSPAATLVEALEPIRSDPDHGRGPARHRRHACADRPARRRRPRSRGHARAADRDRQALPRGRLREWTPCRRPRDRSSRSGRSRTSATTAASCFAPARRAPRWTPSLAVWSARVREFALACAHRRAQRLRVRSEDKDAIAAFHWRGAPDEEAAAVAVRKIAELAEQEGLRGPLGPQGAGGAPARAAGQGPGHRHAAARRAGTGSPVRR